MPHREPKPEDAPDLLSAAEVAAMHGVHRVTVRVAIRAGRLPAALVYAPYRGHGREPRAAWRIRREDAEAWTPEVRQPRTGIITVDPGPRREGELSPTEAAAVKGISETSIRKAIHARRLSARWAPHAGAAAMTVPAKGNTHKGAWWVDAAALEAWTPGPRDAGGTGCSSPPDAAPDELTVTAVAAAIGKDRRTVLAAIRSGKLHARWVPRGEREEWEDPRPPTPGEPGAWLVKQADVEARWGKHADGWDEHATGKKCPQEAQPER